MNENIHAWIFSFQKMLQKYQKQAVANQSARQRNHVMSKGMLYAIGAGPGAADLLTLRAVNILGRIDAILAAASTKNDYSLCLEIARRYIPEHARMQRLEFPMTRDREILEKAWNKAASITLEILDNGENAAFLTIGDPLVYSTFAYLAQALKKLDPEIKMEIVPGITSFQAAASRAGMPLCLGGQALMILSGIAAEDELEKLLSTGEPAVILKTYKNFPAIIKALRETGRLDTCLLVSQAECADEKICHVKDIIEQGHPPYMSLVISPGAKG